MISRFFQFNRKICYFLEAFLPQAKINLLERFEKIVSGYMNSRFSNRVVDIGGGKNCYIAKYKLPHLKTKIIAVDISSDELDHNTDVDEKIVADAVEIDKYFNSEKSEKVDIITSRFLLEHLYDVEKFIVNSRKILNPGGVMIHLLPSRYSVFSLINQFLPNALAKKLLYFFKPETVGFGGFKSYYDKCYYSALLKIFVKNGFDIKENWCYYNSSQYFNFFVPLYLLNAFYEFFVYLFGIKNLCSHFIIVARKNDMQ